MTEYLAIVDHKGNPIKVVNPNDSYNKTMYGDAWKKGNELNLLQSGGEITKPMQQSYIVYSCVNIISDTAPKAPLSFYRGLEKLGPSDPLNRLFARPSVNGSYYELMSKTSMFYALYGEAFWYINESAGQATGLSKIPAEMIVIDPRGMKEVLDSSKELIGWLFDNRVSLTLEEVIHFKSNNPYNSYRGLSPLDAVKFELKSDYSASQYNYAFFENGSTVPFVITTHPDDNMPDKELLRTARQWENHHKGVSKAHKVAVLRGGMDVKTLGLNQKEMAFIESREMNRDIILETFRVPKTIFGADSKIDSRANSEIQEKIFWEMAVQPFLLRVQSKLNAEFLYHIDSTITAKFDFTKIPSLQNIYKEDVDSYWRLIQAGISRNEANERFDLGFPYDEEHGDEKRYMMNLIEVDEDRFENTETPPKEMSDTELKDINKTKRQARYRKMFLRYHLPLERKLKKKIYDFFEMQKNQVLKTIYKGYKPPVDKDNDEPIKLTKADETSIYAGIDLILENENKILIKQTAPIIKQSIETGQSFALEVLGIDRDVIFNEGLLLKKMKRIPAVNDTVWNQLKSTIHSGIELGETIDNIADRIKDVYGKAKKRSILIARTEVTSSINEATLLEYQQNGVPKVEWLSAGDEEVRPEHKSNASVGPLPVGSTFPSGETYPNAPNCRCCISPVIK